MNISKFIILMTVVFVYTTSNIFAQGIIINHKNIYLDSIPKDAILRARDSLHIAYGHTSHGSQLITGMTELAKQSTALKGFKGDIYCWKEYHEVGGNNECLDIDDNFRSGDLGHNGDTSWADATRDYLDKDPVAKDINVVMWSWCGGCSDNTDEGIKTYCNTMSNLEKEYPKITFVYMTGHLDHWSDSKLKRNNQLIRDYCIANNKVLYDFADIESYNPDGKYFEFANDNCDYYDSENGTLQGNWATEWQNSHKENTDWYSCNPAHTKPLNGNLKAYSAWWLWARLAGWKSNTSSLINTKHLQKQKYFSIQYHKTDNKIVINFKSALNSNSTLQIITVSGKQSNILFNKLLNAGTTKYTTSLRNIPNGVFVITLKSKLINESQKIVLMN